MKFSVQKMATWLKVNPIRKVITVLLIGLVSVFIWEKIMDGTKVIDPSDPRFNPEKFRFEDYAQSGELYELLSATLLTMFPPGTEQKYIEHILVNNAGTGVRMNADGDYTYSVMTYSGLSGWIVRIKYDDNGHAVAMYRRGTPLYDLQK